jgi:hypothetical protein
MWRVHAEYEEERCDAIDSCSVRGACETHDDAESVDLGFYIFGGKFLQLYLLYLT